MSNPLHFEQLRVGDQWISPARTVTETDVVNFAGLTGDFDPLHTDHHHAAKSPFGRPIAHGLLGLSFVAGLSSQSPRVSTCAFVDIQDWKFLKPIYFGDTVHVVTKVTALDSATVGRAGQVTWKRQLINHEGLVLQEGVLRTLVNRNTRLRRPPRPKSPVTRVSEASDMSDLNI